MDRFNAVLVRAVDGARKDILWQERSATGTKAQLQRAC